MDYQAVDRQRVTTYCNGGVIVVPTKGSKNVHNELRNLSSSSHNTSHGIGGVCSKHEGDEKYIHNFSP
jgi:hypothetical protein